MNSASVMTRGLNKVRLIAYAEALFTVIIWGASFVATKVSLRYISPVTLVWLRFGIGVVILGVATLVRRQFAWPARNELGYFALLGFLGITLHQWLQSTGLQTAQATTSAWIVATIPVFMALLGLAFLKEKLRWLQVVGIALSAAGVLLVVSKGDFSTLTTGKFGTFGDILILISAPNWAIFSILSRRGLQQHPATRMMFYVMCFGWLFSTGLFFTAPELGKIGQMGLDGWVATVFLGVVVSGLAYIAWYDALKVIPASQIGAFLYLEPLATMVVAAMVLREPLLVTSLLGGGLILLGVWMVNRSG
jgi:drug/metabolite transporter (DMT)-like permease